MVLQVACRAEQAHPPVDLPTFVQVDLRERVRLSFFGRRVESRAGHEVNAGDVRGKEPAGHRCHGHGDTPALQLGEGNRRLSFCALLGRSNRRHALSEIAPEQRDVLRQVEVPIDDGRSGQRSASVSIARLRILPVGPFGRSSTKITSRGYL